MSTDYGFGVRPPYDDNYADQYEDWAEQLETATRENIANYFGDELWKAVNESVEDLVIPIGWDDAFDDMRDDLVSSIYNELFNEMKKLWEG